ncbi:MAG: FkbM family methyltransferase [Gemmatimonadota bacterium]
MSPALVLALRRLTVPARTIRGAILLLEPIRRYFTRVGGSYTVRYDRDLLIDLSLDQHMESQIFWYGAYSRDVLMLLDRLLRPGMTVVDAGANIGEIALAAGARVGASGCVLAFEPQPDLTERLRRHVAANQLQTTIRVSELGLSDRSATATLFASAGAYADGSHHNGLASLYQSACRGQPVSSIRLVTLDSFLETAPVDHLDLIKVDVEGAELAVLQGARGTLGRFRPALIVEVQQESSLAAGYDQRNILDFLAPFGYQFFTILRGGRLRPLTAESLQPFQNVLCRVPASA